MRVKSVGLGALLVGALGCFNAVSELNEAEAVAEALTRGMRFDGGEVRDGNVPDGLAQEVFILPPSLPTVMSPGQASLMAFDSDNPGELDNPAESTLMQFVGSRKHIRVAGKGSYKGEGNSGSRFEHSFNVESNICDGLCNKQHAVKLRVALKLRDGRISRSQTLNLTLDCSEDGDSNACERSSGGIGGLPSTVYLEACQNAAGVCSNVAESTGISSDVVECVALYQCVQAYFVGDSLCQGLVESLVECMADSDSASSCNACGSITTELENNCTYPDVCLGLPTFDGDASVGPAPIADASRPPPGVDFIFTDSLTQNCAMMCDIMQGLGCATFSDTCQQDCEGGFAGTVCEKAVVDFQRCAWQMTADQTISCGDTTMPLDPSADCPAEAQQLSQCFLDNPGILPGGVDAGLPGGPDAGQ